MGGGLQPARGFSTLPGQTKSRSRRRPARNPRRHAFIFIGFTQEEAGLVGSRFYAKVLAPGERARISPLVNMDSLGLSPTAVWLSHADPVGAKMAWTRCCRPSTFYYNSYRFLMAYLAWIGRELDPEKPAK